MSTSSNVRRRSGWFILAILLLLLGGVGPLYSGPRILSCVLLASWPSWRVYFVFEFLVTTDRAYPLHELK